MYGRRILFLNSDALERIIFGANSDGNMDGRQERMIFGGSSDGIIDGR